MGLLVEVLGYFELLLAAIGEDATVFVLSLVLGSTLYFGAPPVVRSSATVGVKTGTWAYKRLATDIWDRAMTYFDRHGWNFQGFTKRSATVAVVCALMIYILLKLAVKAPSYWHVSAAIVASVLIGFSFYGYRVAGDRITPRRFTRLFYVPTIAALGFLLLSTGFDRLLNALPNF